jgi:hypothetical protein
MSPSLGLLAPGYPRHPVSFIDRDIWAPTTGPSHLPDHLLLVRHLESYTFIILHPCDCSFSTKLFKGIIVFCLHKFVQSPYFLIFFKYIPIHSLVPRNFCSEGIICFFAVILSQSLPKSFDRYFMLYWVSNFPRVCFRFS